MTGDSFPQASWYDWKMYAGDDTIYILVEKVR
jgi:hypothetical protein